MRTIRLLKASEIEVRVQSYNANTGKAIFLLYIDSRACVKLLNETFGIDGWQREHIEVNGKLFCSIKIWSERLNQWIIKQDVGTESNTEKEKGQVSDSFKRALVNLGLTELYTAPMISVPVSGNDIYNGKCTLKLSVKEVDYNEDREIIKLVLVDKFDKVRYTFNKGEAVKVESNAYSNNNNNTTKIANYKLSEKQIARLIAIGKKAGQDEAIIKKVAKKDYKVENLEDLNKADYEALCERLEKASQK